MESIDEKTLPVTKSPNLQKNEKQKVKNVARQDQTP
jgi:hypothetical protein